MPKRPTRREASLQSTIESLSRGKDVQLAPSSKRPQKTRIMYIECKSGGLTGPARIGRVVFSKTGRTLRYREQEFQSLKGAGYKANYYDLATGDRYWISGPHKDGSDRLYGERVPIEIDEDVREEYWRDIRGLPKRVKDKHA